MKEIRTDTPIKMWLTEPLADDVARSIERLASAEDVVRLAIMPDVHLASDVCVGAVVATTEVIYPAAVGGDIGCGMAAVRIAADTQLLASEIAAARLLAGLYRCVPSNRLPSAVDTACLPLAQLSSPMLAKLAQREGRVQLGTLGRGNHFLEFQADQNDRLWLMVHSGSRAMGQAIAAHHLQRAQRLPGGLFGLDCSKTAGLAYLQDHDWAVEYARLNRQAMLDAVARLLRTLFGVSIERDTTFDTPHNFVRYETHDGERLLVHRKGAQSAKADEPGIVPGSMGTASFHVTGRGCEAALLSCAHGAGRKLRRGDALRSISKRQLDQQMQAVWFDRRQSDALRDEAPTAYKDIHAVIRAQRELTRIVRELRPVLSYKGV